MFFVCIYRLWVVAHPRNTHVVVVQLLVFLCLLLLVRVRVCWVFCRIFCPPPSFIVLLLCVGIFGLALPKIVDVVCWLGWRADWCVLLSVGCPDVLDQRMLRVRRSPSVQFLRMLCKRFFQYISQLFKYTYMFVPLSNWFRLFFFKYVNQICRRHDNPITLGDGWRLTVRRIKAKGACLRSGVGEPHRASGVCTNHFLLWKLWYCQ